MPAFFNIEYQMLPGRVLPTRIMPSGLDSQAIMAPFILNFFTGLNLLSSPPGRADGGPARDGQNAPGQSRGYRMRHHLLQRLFVDAVLQMARRV